MKQEVNGNTYMTDSRGRLVPEANVAEIDKLRDEVADELVKERASARLVSQPHPRKILWLGGKREGVDIPRGLGASAAHPAVRASGTRGGVQTLL